MKCLDKEDGVKLDNEIHPVIREVLHFQLIYNDNGMYLWDSGFAVAVRCHGNRTCNLFSPTKVNKHLYV